MNSKTKQVKKEKTVKRLGRAGTGALSILLAIIFSLGLFDYIIPDSVSFRRGEEPPAWMDAHITLRMPQDDAVFANAKAGDTAVQALCETSEGTACLFGTVPIKEVSVHEIDNRTVIPGGMLFGVKLYTQGLLVVSTQSVITGQGEENPAAACGIKAKDMIEAVNGKKTATAQDFSNEIKNSDGKEVCLTVQRGKQTMEIPITPVYCEQTQSYQTGLVVRDNTSGIGTVTFIDSRTGIFCGLGHGICDTDTGSLLPLSRGTLMEVQLSGVHAGSTGAPGELCGYFNSHKTGSLLGNTECGVFGVFQHTADHVQPVSIGLSDEITTGPAQILCTVTADGTCRAYDIEILRLNGEDRANKNFTLKITDPDLLSVTGGIVQGMSGSPVIQNGKLVGAVTHVMVNDPEKGYGIFIENMLSAMPDALE